jgi:hypothetical protein
MKNFEEYVNKTNQELIAEKAITGTPDTQISGLRNVILEASPAIRIFNNVVLSGEDTNLPVLDLPNSTATDFVLGGITIDRDNISTESTIRDETIEDAVPDLSAALNSILASQTILKMEGAIAAQLTTATAVTGDQPRNFETVVDVLNSFPDQYNSIVGTWYVFGTHATLRAMLSEFTSAQLNLLDTFNVEFIPLYGLPSSELVVGHGHGLAGGFRINQIEGDREGGSNETVLVANASAGIGFASDFVKKVKITN